MKAYEFPSVQETRRQVEQKFASFRQRLAEHPVRARTSAWVPMYLSPSVQEARRRVHADFAFFRRMMAGKE